ncbi:unnamed protein product [Lymnaea stagnalis]|uniref:Uncharacterized protein n=1 Tax=Lymnaea stagnalis TaxID=6523 RepID=A0AAV2H4Q8_LYMST
MKLLYPRLSALKRAFIMCLVFVAGANTSEFEIGVYPTYMDDIKTNISFNGDMLVRFRDCLCNKLTIKCNADLNCSNEACQVSNISSIAQKGFRVNRQYHCFLGLKTKGVFCRRLSTPPNSHWNAVFYTSYASECQLNCVQIYWNRTQFVDINCSFTDIILSGNAPSTCNVTTTSTTQTTPTPTTTVLTAATTIKQQTSQQ